MLAARRNERVIGRTAILTVSIKIKKGVSQAGAPAGRRDARVVRGLNIALEMIRESHRGSPNARVKMRWEVALNTKGIIPKKFIAVTII
jgi:hypothetical protein